MSVQIQLRRGTEAEWAEADPVLALAEPGVATDTRVYKIGDGSTTWADLPSVAEADAAAMIAALRTELVDEVIPAEVQGAMGDHGITVDTSVGTRVFVGGVMVYGDTGWRDVRYLLPEHWEVRDVTQHRIEMKRENNTVHLVGRVAYVDDGENRSRGSGIPILNATPSGFGVHWIYQVLGPAAYYRGSQFNTATDQGLAYFAGAPSARFFDTDQAWSNNEGLGFNLTWHTSDSWPTSLPGTPA